MQVLGTQSHDDFAPSVAGEIDVGRGEIAEQEGRVALNPQRSVARENSAKEVHRRLPKKPATNTFAGFS